MVLSAIHNWCSCTDNLASYVFEGLNCSLTLVESPILQESKIYLTMILIHLLDYCAATRRRLHLVS